jgi:hypothetical protein
VPERQEQPSYWFAELRKFLFEKVRSRPFVSADFVIIPSSIPHTLPSLFVYYIEEVTQVRFALQDSQ